MYTSPRLSAEDIDNIVEAAGEVVRMDQMTLIEDDLRISIRILKPLLILWRESLRMSTIPKKLKI